MIWQDIQAIRAQTPLVLNITNYVVMNTSANALLALGASPVMAHAIEEVEDMVGIARALVINIGTLSAPWVEAMFRAGRAARRRGIPLVLDPVGCGATSFRTETARALVKEFRPDVIRGNASEIRALVGGSGATRGVDSLDTPESARSAAEALSLEHGSVVSVSGAEDLIVSGRDVMRVANGTPTMTRVTGMGCTASALTGAFVAVNSSPFQAAASAMVTMGVAGEIAASRSAGPGSFQLNFLDALFGLDEATVKQRTRLQGP